VQFWIPRAIERPIVRVGETVGRDPTEMITGRRESECLVVGQAEQCTGVLRGDGGQVCGGEAADFGEFCGGQCDTGGLVHFSAEGMGGEVGAVGFDQEAVKRHSSGHLAQGVECLVREGDHSGKGKM
jgi:hypothetical protein